MRRSIIPATIFIAMLSASALGQDAKQDKSEETCAGPVYERKEVTRPSKFAYRQEPQYTEEARAHQLHGLVILTVILCRTGQVTDIVVVEGLPYGMTERVVEAVRRFKFIPAEKD